jgi:hypothetical protein
MKSSRQYAAQRRAEHDAAVGAGKDVNNFRRNADGEVLFGFALHNALLQDIGALVEKHGCEAKTVNSVGLSFDVPESAIAALMTALSALGIFKYGYNIENFGRINAR